MMESPSPSPPFTPYSSASGKKKKDDRRSRLRPTFPGEPPLDASPSLTTGGLSGGEAEGFAVGAQQEEGYMSFAALR